MLRLFSQCAYAPVLATLSLILSAVYLTMTHKYSLLSCTSYRVDYPLSTCNSHPVSQRTAAEQFSFVVHSSERKIFLKGDKREDARFSEGMYQLTCRSVSLSLTFRNHNGDAHSCFSGCMHKFIGSAWNAGPAEVSESFATDLNGAKIPCYVSKGSSFLPDVSP